MGSRRPTGLFSRIWALFFGRPAPLSDYARARQLIAAVDRGGIPLNPAKVNQIAQVLMTDMGMKSGQRLLLRGGNSPMMAACFLAALKAGLVVVPTMPLLRAADLKQIVDKAQISAALCDSLLAKWHLVKEISDVNEEFVDALAA